MMVATFLLYGGLKQGIFLILLLSLLVYFILSFCMFLGALSGCSLSCILYIFIFAVYRHLFTSVLFQGVVVWFYCFLKYSVLDEFLESRIPMRFGRFWILERGGGYFTTDVIDGVIGVFYMVCA